MFPVILKFGFLTIHSYGLMVALAFLVGFTIAKKQFDLYGLPLSMLDHLVMAVMVSGIFGARFFYLSTEGFENFREDPFQFFRIWEGGLVFFGGFIAAIVAVWCISLFRKIPFFLLADALVGPLLIAQSLGRIGCFAAGCCFGKPTTAPWAVVFHHPDTLAPAGVSLHPTQLYEAFSMLGLFLLWMWIQPKSRKLGPGLGVAFYMMSYGCVRFSIELFRGDFRGPSPLGLYPSQWIAAISVLMGGVLLFRLVEKFRAGE